MLKTLRLLFIFNLAALSCALEAAWDPTKTLTNLQTGTEKMAGRIQGTFTKTQCYPNNCRTLEGAVECLKTNSKFATYSRPARFFQTTPDGKMVQVIVPATIGLKLIKNEADRNKDTYEKITISVARNVVSPAVFTSTRQVALENPNCLDAFCKANCIMIYEIDKKAIAQQAKLFSSAVVPVTIRGQEFSVVKLRSVDDEFRQVLARNYLMDGQNYKRAADCLKDDQRGALLRILCTQCPDSDSKAFEINPACSAFDPSQSVAFDQKSAEEKAVIRELAQNQQEALENSTKFVSGPVANIDLAKLINDLKTAGDKVHAGIDTAKTGKEKVQSIYNQHIGH